MSERHFDPDRVRYVKGGRPHFFDDPAVDKLLAMVMALLGEVCVLRERLDAHERLAQARGMFGPGSVDDYLPDAESEGRRTADRELIMSRVLSVLTEEIARERAEASTPGGEGA